jgi:hypothetical protein
MRSLNMRRRGKQVVLILNLASSLPLVIVSPAAAAGRMMWAAMTLRISPQEVEAAAIGAAA